MGDRFEIPLRCVVAAALLGLSPGSPAAAEKASVQTEFRDAVSEFFETLVAASRLDPAWPSLEDEVEKVKSEVEGIHSPPSKNASALRVGKFDEQALRESIRRTFHLSREFEGRGDVVFNFLQASHHRATGRDLFLTDHLMERMLVHRLGGVEIPPPDAPPDPEPPNFKVIKFDLTEYSGQHSIFPKRWLGYDRRGRDAAELGRWARDRIGRHSVQRAGDPLVLAIGQKPLVRGGTAWLETVEKRGDNLTFIFGHTEFERRNYSKMPPKPFFLIDLGAFKPGNKVLRTRWKRYWLPEVDAGKDDLGRPVGRKLDVQEKYAFYRNLTKILKIYPSPSQGAAKSPSDNELQHRVDASSRIFVVERKENGLIAPPLAYLKGPDDPTTAETYPALQKDLLSRPATEWTWIAFLPDSKQNSAIVATPELAERIRRMVSPPFHWTPIGDTWAFGIRRQSARVKIGKPIRLEIITRNTSDSLQNKLALSMSGAPYFPMTRFRVTAPDGKRYSLQSLTKPKSRRAFPMEIPLRPGEWVAEPVSLDQWQRVDEKPESIFQQPGEYRVTCFFDPSKVDVAREQRRKFWDH